MKFILCLASFFGKVTENWRLLWAMKVSPWVKDFLWRACRECLSIKENLFTKKIVTKNGACFVGIFSKLHGMYLWTVLLLEIVSVQHVWKIW